MRSRMAVDTGLVVVGSADDQLRMTKTKKRLEGITQNMVDRCILVRMSCRPFTRCLCDCEQVYSVNVSL